MLEKIRKISDFLKDKGFTQPVAGIILGTGLGGLTSGIENNIEIDYKDIPDFPVSTVDGHEGKLIYGDLGGKKVIAMKGRFHFYEGHGSDMIALPVRVLKYLGVESLFLSNAAGGVNPDFRIGDIMVITDHINLLPNPLIGTNDDRLGVRFPDMGVAYDRDLIDQGLAIAGKHNISVRKGIYLATTGPTYETPAEYKYFRIIGADAVGMSTASEVIVARHMNLRCFALSVITDLGVEGRIEYITHEMVQAEAEKAEERIATLITELISSL
ncbi:MAG: purine-nucleoside phosphorylase [Bacteroidales bacterium]|nr:purine-nucleoside phosphorylase [Bacteroidales bacterium]